jgi:GNAT superfamily N-acetyltransferase
MALPEGFTIRRASTDDLTPLVEHRRSMFYDMGYCDHAAMDAMALKFRPWLQKRMDAGEYLAWLGVSPDGSIAAGTGLWLMDWPPHMIGTGVRRGNILNVYTVEKFRRRGLARQLMEVAIQWCRENRVDTIILHAAPDGRKLYESLGFSATNEMRIRL